jgi:dolichol-phosphate mannosyltransferase
MDADAFRPPGRHAEVSALSETDLSVVVPLFDEQENLEELYRRLGAVLAELPGSSEIILVDDGSRDATPHLLDSIARNDDRVVSVRLSRNFGHQAAISAGLDLAQGRAVVVMDGDLQDPPEVIGDFLSLWRDGYDVVYAVRGRRRENWPRRFAYALFYRVLRAISDIPIPLDSGDFCLMDRRVVEAIRQLPERRRFVRGLRTFVGFRQVGLTFDRPARAAGRPKYTFRKLLGLAIDGLVSFSGYPLRLVTYLGLISAAIALALTVWVLNDAIRQRTAPPGWASTLVVVLFMGSIQLVSLGIIGEYIRLIFLESKRRPAYVIDQIGPASGDDSRRDAESSTSTPANLMHRRRFPVSVIPGQRT